MSAARTIRRTRGITTRSAVSGLLRVPDLWAELHSDTLPVGPELPQD